MSKRKDSPQSRYSLWSRMLQRVSEISFLKIFQRNTGRRGASCGLESRNGRGRQRESVKNSAPHRCVRIVLFSTWGSDYHQIDLSATAFGGVIFVIVLLFGVLTAFTTLAVNRVVQNYRLSVLTKNQQVLRNRLSQTEDRVLNMSRRLNNLSDKAAYGLTDYREQNESSTFLNTTKRNSLQRDAVATAGRVSSADSNKRGPLGLRWTYGSQDTPGELPSDALEDKDSSLFYGQGGGAYIDEEDNIYPTLLEKERIRAIMSASELPEDQKISAATLVGGDLISTLENRVSQTQELQKAIVEKFEIRRKQLMHIPSIKPLLTGRITDLFGKRVDPFVTRVRHHQGLDIAAPRGTEVFAPANGVIELVKTTYRRHSGYGKAVVINHGYGIKTLYGHLSQIKVKKGQKVERWDLIGMVGETGRATGPHLHYEVWVDGQATDPLRFILNN